MNDEAVWQVPDSLLRKLVQAAVVFGEQGGLAENFSRLNALIEQCHQHRAVPFDESDTLMNKQIPHQLITHTRLHIRKNGEATTVDIPIGEIDEWIQKFITEPERGRIVRTESLMSVSIGMDSAPYFYESDSKRYRTTVLLTPAEYDRFKRFEANYDEIQNLIGDKYFERPGDQR